MPAFMPGTAVLVIHSHESSAQIFQSALCEVRDLRTEIVKAKIVIYVAYVGASWRHILF